MSFRLLLYYLLGVNLLTFLAYGLDKWKAVRNGRRSGGKAHRNDNLSRRIPEASLLLLAALGSSPAALVAMYLFRHKTLHKKFRYGVPAILLVQIAVVVWLLNGNQKICIFAF
jgi:uncharacterized membrane protein YsdA (DUF1294 family)